MAGNEHELSAAELDQEQAAELPDREAMSVITDPVANPVNSASIVNYLSNGATQTASQSQDVTIVQGP